MVIPSLVTFTGEASGYNGDLHGQSSLFSLEVSLDLVAEWRATLASKKDGTRWHSVLQIIWQKLKIAVLKQWVVHSVSRGGYGEVRNQILVGQEKIASRREERGEKLPAGAVRANLAV